MVVCRNALVSPLPDGLCSLSTLRELNLNNNKLTELPAELGVSQPACQPEGGRPRTLPPCLPPHALSD